MPRTKRPKGSITPQRNSHISPNMNGAKSPGNPRLRRPIQSQTGQQTSTPSLRTSTPSTSKNTTTPTPQRPMSMSPEARLVWNLKVLRRHDALITRIFDQVPYAVLYTFNHAHTEDPDGGKGKKYEGHWEKTNAEGTVFIIERSEEPRYGFFLLNRGGTSSVVQMFHQDDTIEVGADTKFLTFRPGVWDRATTPYTEPVTRCAKPTLICLWLSDESAGPRFAHFISRVKEHLIRASRYSSEPTGSPPLTPLSQIHDRSDSESSPEMEPLEVVNATPKREQSGFSEDANASRPPNERFVEPKEESTHPTERPLDKLFATLSMSANTHSTTALVTTDNRVTDNSSRGAVVATATSSPSGFHPAFRPASRTSGNTQRVDRGQALLESLMHSPQVDKRPQQSAATESGSLLDKIFASAATVADNRTLQFTANAKTRQESLVGTASATTSRGRALLASTSPSFGDEMIASQSPQAIPAEWHRTTGPVTPPQRRKAAFRQVYDEDDDSDEIILMSDRESHANGVTHSTSGSSTHHPFHTAAYDGDDVFQELDAPSPSLIPNPLHTPKVVLPRRQKTNEKSRRLQAFHESQMPPLHADAATRPAVRQKGRKKETVYEHYIPRNVDTASKVNADAVAMALLDSHDVHRKDETRSLSKYDFVSEVLTLIHKDQTFVDDLYARYQRLATGS